MSIVNSPPQIVEEIANLLASSPTADQLLAFHPSEGAQHRARELLAKASNDASSPDEQREISQFEQAELLMRLVKARVYSRQAQ